jgi:hypothetical protein
MRDGWYRVTWTRWKPKITEIHYVENDIDLHKNFRVKWLQEAGYIFDFIFTDEEMEKMVNERQRGD